MLKAKIIAFLLGVFFLFNVGCRKTLEATVTDDNIDFYLSGNNAYISSEMSATVISPVNTTYNWNFGDGSPQTSGTVAKHTYTRSGIFTVTLTAGGKSSTRRIRIFPGELSYQVKNSIDRDLKDYQCRILDPSGSNIYTLNGSILSEGSMTDTIFISLGSNRVGSELLIDANVQSNKGNMLRFGTGGNFDKGKHNFIDVKPATQGNFYQTSGSIPLPSAAVTIGTAIANY